MQSKGFSWKAPHLTSDHYFSGAQTLSTDLNSAANLSFSTRSSLNSLIRYLSIFRCWGPCSCLLSPPSSSQVPTNLGLTAGIWRGCPRSLEESELCQLVDNASSAVLEEQAFTTESGC